MLNARILIAAALASAAIVSGAGVGTATAAPAGVNAIPCAEAQLPVDSPVFPVPRIAATPVSLPPGDTVELRMGVGAGIGAVLGGLAGLPFLVVGAIPGAIIGAGIGAGIGYISHTIADAYSH